MCKWQMDDPEARVKSSLSDCTWLEDLSMDLSSRHLRTYEAKRTEEHLYFFLPLFYFLSLLLFFFIIPFSLLFFSSHHIFFIFHFFLLLLRTFCNIILHSICQRWCNDSSSMLNDACPRAEKRGEMTAKVSINSIILWNIWISIENFTPYSNWVVEVITKRCFGLGWIPNEVCEIFDVKTHNAWTNRLAWKSYTKEWPAS
jgi:hypothetical protein